LKENKLLQICFTTLSEYLWLLKSACQALTALENRAVLYLAAAVSDFYIPSNEMASIFVLKFLIRNECKPVKYIFKYF
jgi:phosphopantothenate-cysteine ligase